jgi:PAS domain S-box-containing protein
MLIVEDEQVVAADLQSSLESLGYEVVAMAESGRTAVCQAEQSRPDLVLMDIQLKGSIDGIAAAEEIRRRFSIPIIFVTANAEGELLTRANAAAPYGFVIKPFRAKDLNATIRAALNQHRLLQDLFKEHTWFLTTLGSLNDGFIATDNEGLVRYMNPSAEALTGWKVANAAGKPIEDVYRLMTMNSKPVQSCQLRRALKTGAPIPKERFLVHHLDGRKIPVEDAAAPIVNEGHVIGAVTVFTDITDRLRYEREAELARDRLEEQMHVVTEVLGQTRSELRALSDHLMTAQEEERRRIGRELHDDFGQKTAVLEWQLDQLSKMVRLEGPAEKLVQTIRSIAAEVSDGLRDASHRFYPAVLNHGGLLAGLRQLVATFQDGGVSVSLQTDLSQVQLPLDVATALYRITQEALRNITKHTNGAPARISVYKVSKGLRLIIEDTGPGFDLTTVRTHGSDSLGLISMQERARMAGGTMTLQTAPGKGTQIIVQVPMNTTQAKAAGER